MTQANDLPSRVQQLENGQSDLKLAVRSLIATVERHQAFHEATDRNVQTLQRNIRTMLEAFTQRFDQFQTEMIEMRTDIRTMQAEVREMQADVRGLQTENRRILDVLQGLIDGPE